MGRGWFIILGLLVLAVGYLTFALSGTRAEVDDLRTELAQVKDQAAKVESQPVAEPSPTPSSGPDLATALGRDTLRKADLKKIAAALAAYQKANDLYPGSLNELTPDYLDRVPADPSAPRFNYRYKRIEGGFTLTSILERAKDPEDPKGDGKSDKVLTYTQSSNVE